MTKNRSRKMFLLVSVGSMLLLYGVFYIFPISFGFVGSFANWHPLKKTFDFIGLKNYIEIFSDGLFSTSIVNTLVFTLVCTLCTTLIGMLLALLVTSLRRGQGVFKTMIYMPYVTAIIAVAVVWRWIFMAQGGLINNALAVLGIQGPNWLNSSQSAMPSLMIVTVWHDVGFALILFIAGLLEIPETYYEAAVIDGANRFQVFARITIPLLRPTLALVTVTNIITYVQVYDQVVALTRGGPGEATYTISYFLFDKALSSYRFGYASATAVVMLVIIMGLSLLQMKLTNQTGKED